jgi:hypothetical protein
MRRAARGKTKNSSRKKVNAAKKFFQRTVHPESGAARLTGRKFGRVASARADYERKKF